MSKPIEIQGAEWLILAFKRCWNMQMLRRQLETLDPTFSSFPFMPESLLWYYKGCQVRAFVAQNYPKLARFLTDAPGEKQLKAVGQIVKLRPTVERSQGALTQKERDEIHKIRRHLRQATASYRISREVFKSAQGHEWNTCK